MAMTMVGAAATSMMMMKAMGAIKLFIIHSFFATKLALVIGAYLLACKMMEMKQTPPKKVVKWVSAPPSFDEHGSAAMMMPAPYPDSIQSSYEPHQDQQQQQAPSDQYGPPPSDQYGPPPSSQHQSQFGDFGGGGDMQAHYSHVSPVTYRPMIKSDKLTKSGVGRIQWRVIYPSTTARFIIPWRMKCPIPSAQVNPTKTFIQTQMPSSWPSLTP